MSFDDRTVMTFSIFSSQGQIFRRADTGLRVGCIGIAADTYYKYAAANSN